MLKEILKSRIRTTRFDKLLREYIYSGVLLPAEKRNLVNCSYSEIGQECDNDSGAAGEDEIFSFFLRKTWSGCRYDIELKFYFRRCVWIADSVYFFGKKLRLGMFFKLIDNVWLAGARAFIYGSPGDEGVVIFQNGVILRFQILDGFPYVYQIEGLYAADSLQSNASRIESISKRMEEVSLDKYI
ncbi:hypothetical protein E2553_09130 [Paraburkholderia dipogonis]|uniref:Uncharacterized protein n=1 Tax=Paraburkholderia dipogonis TaxID=1211383 RepID=A0A4Y8N5W6_9BURK|nr:hypothetical protein [Paraburkholderia dipogonis]TFE45159.1 hypothetical protein E2553_09130 [Paraburkholderia dipogonis]